MSLIDTSGKSSLLRFSLKRQRYFHISWHNKHGSLQKHLEKFNMTIPRKSCPTLTTISTQGTQPNCAVFLGTLLHHFLQVTQICDLCGNVSPWHLREEKKRWLSKLTLKSWKVSFTYCFYRQLRKRGCKVTPELAVMRFNLITVGLLLFYWNISTCYTVVKKEKKKQSLFVFDKILLLWTVNQAT